MSLFKIPIMSIQDKIDTINGCSKVITLKAWLTEKVRQERNDWLINGYGFSVGIAREQPNGQLWYPIFYINNVQLTSAFIEHLAEIKPWKKERKEKVFKLNSEKQIFVRVTKNGKIHATVVEGKSTVYIGCRPWGWGVTPSNEFKLKDIEVIKDITKRGTGEICKTCINMGNITRR